MKPLSLHSTIVLVFFPIFFPALADNSPYRNAKFQAVLESSKLQAPDSGSTAVEPGDFSGFWEWYFYLDDTGESMSFKMTGKKNRSELRQMHEWYTSTSKWRRMVGEVKVFYPTTDSLDEFTFMQVHDSGHFNKPLLRLVWMRDNGGSKDHLWAVFRLSNREDRFQRINLGERPNDFFRCEIKIKNNKLIIRINNENQVELDVNYWEDYSSYFKAGVYLQTEGSAKVQFHQLSFIDEL